MTPARPGFGMQTQAQPSTFGAAAPNGGLMAQPAQNAGFGAPPPGMGQPQGMGGMPGYGNQPPTMMQQKMGQSLYQKPTYNSPLGGMPGYGQQPMGGPTDMLYRGPQNQNQMSDMQMMQMMQMRGQMPQQSGMGGMPPGMDPRMQAMQQQMYNKMGMGGPQGFGAPPQGFGMPQQGMFPEQRDRGYYGAIPTLKTAQPVKRNQPAATNLVQGMPPEPRDRGYYGAIPGMKTSGPTKPAPQMLATNTMQGSGLGALEAQFGGRLGNR